MLVFVGGDGLVGLFGFGFFFAFVCLGFFGGAVFVVLVLLLVLVFFFFDLLKPIVLFFIEH